MVNLRENYTILNGTIKTGIYEEILRNTYRELCKEWGKQVHLLEEGKANLISKENPNGDIYYSKKNNKYYLFFNTNSMNVDINFYHDLLEYYEFKGWVEVDKSNNNWKFNPVVIFVEEAE